MPEGHSVHRIARQFDRTFVGQRAAVSSPQGRFAAGAREIDGRRMTEALAVGKQMFLEFDGDRWLRVHLGLYGAWDFAGEILTDAAIASAKGRMGQTMQRGTVLDEAGEDSLNSIGAPRRARLRMAESEKAGPNLTAFPPEPVGAVRVRILTATAVADLRGPTACEVLQPEEVQTVLARLGPDPLVDDEAEGGARFVAKLGAKRTPVGLLLMDQSVVSGIGNVYRAELLFRARLNPHTPGKAVGDAAAIRLWQDWAYLLGVGVATGQMMTMDNLDPDSRGRALARRADRHWVYHREGRPCRVCDTPIVMEIAAARKLYYCPYCQA